MSKISVERTLFKGDGYRVIHRLKLPNSNHPPHPPHQPLFGGGYGNYGNYNNYGIPGMGFGLSGWNGSPYNYGGLGGPYPLGGTYPAGMNAGFNSSYGSDPWSSFNSPYGYGNYGSPYPAGMNDLFYKNNGNPWHGFNGYSNPHMYPPPQHEKPKKDNFLNVLAKLGLFSDMLRKTPENFAHFLKELGNVKKAWAELSKDEKTATSSSEDKADKADKTSS